MSKKLIKKQNKHDEILDNLEKRVQSNPNSLLTFRNYEYNRHGYIGEIDLLLLHKQGYYVMYEVKSSPARMTKARKQYTQFCNAHQELNVKSVYVSEDYCKRIYKK